MEVRNCKMCGRLFNYAEGRPICQACRQKLEEKFQEVKEYIRKNKEAGIVQVAEENDVSVSQIKQWIREERLAFAPDAQVGIECENCGTNILTGRFCNACKDKMKNGLSDAFKREMPKEEPVKKQLRDKERMRFLDGSR